MNEIKDFLKSRAIMNLVIVLLNIGVFIVMELIGDTEDVQFMLTHGANYTPWVLEHGEYYRIFTCMFLHFGIEHLFSNMLVLIFLGDTLERTVGKIRYLLIYVIGGLCGNLLSMWYDMKTGDFAVSAGASGAVFAVIGALVFIIARNKGKLEDLTGKRLGLMAALTLFQGFSSAGIDNSAHVGGLITGVLLAVLLYRKKKRVSIEQGNYDSMQ